MIDQGTAESAGPGGPVRRRQRSLHLRLAVTILGGSAYGLILGVLLQLPRVEIIRLALTTMLLVAVSEATETWMERLRARSGLLHALVLFAGGVAGTALLFFAMGDRPTVLVLVVGFISVLSGRRPRPRKPDEDWIESRAGGSRDDGRRWRTGTP